MKALLSVLLIGFGAIVTFTSDNLGVEFVGLLAAVIGSFILGVIAEKKNVIKKIESYKPGQTRDVGVG